MTRTRIKICGLTRPQDAAAAVEAGADACGVVFAPSKRQVTIERAREVLVGVPIRVARVGVFVDADPEFVQEAVLRCGLTAVQYHGSESPDACSQALVPAVKAFGIGTVFDTSDLEPYRGHVAAVLLDKLSAREAGGTGETFDWHLITDVPGRVPTFLAGGLDPDNVASAIAAVRPFAVDVSSGVESSPGIKDAELIRAFVAAVRHADQQLSAKSCDTLAPDPEVFR